MWYTQEWEELVYAWIEGFEERLVSAWTVEGVKSVMKSFNVDLQRACEGLGITVEEYNKAEECMSEPTFTIVKSVESVMKNFHVDLQRACEGLGTTVEEYYKKKEYMFNKYT